MELTVAQRIWLLNIVPKTGTLIDYRVLRDLNRDLSFSEEEIARLQLRDEGGAVKWNAATEAPKEVEIGARAHTLVAAALKKLGETGPVNDQNYTLFELWGITETPGGEGIIPSRQDEVAEG